MSAEDHIGHLFVVDIKFNEEKANEKNLLFNKIYTPTFEKKVLPASQRSTFHLLDAMRLNDKGLLNSFKTTAKIHSTMEKEYLISLPHMHFLVKRCNWLVTRIYSDYNFEQSKFKKAFVVMNYVSWQNPKTKVEKDFYKLLNNPNFGYNCRNNADNCFFAPVFDEIE